MIGARRTAFLVLVLFLVAELPALAQMGLYHFGRNKIQYEDFDWHVLQTEHFDFYYYPEMQELAEHGAFFAEEIYDELENKFNFSLNHRVPMIFYASNLHFKQTNVTPGFIPDGVGGFYEFLKGRVVVPANGNIHQFRRVIRHEMVHVFTFNKVMRVMRDHRKAPDRFLPLWFTEGIAEYWSAKPDHQHEMVIRDALFSNYLVPLENMYRISGSYQMYKQGEAICRFLSETYGEERLLDLIDNVWRDRDFRKVMEFTFQEDFVAISDKWSAWLKHQYYPQLEQLELASLVADGIAARGFSAKPYYYTFGDGTREVYYVGNQTGYSNVYKVRVDSAFRALEKPKVLIRGERDDTFEAFHLFESRMSVSADGKLAFVTKSGEGDVIHVYDLVAREMVKSYGFADLIAIYSPSWNPDGTQLAFMSIGRNGYSDLFTYNITDDVLRRLTHDSFDDRDPAWSPDGQYIAFSSDRTSKGKDGFYNLFTYKLDDGTVQYVTYGARKDFSPRWSPDGKHLVFTSTRRDTTGKFSAQNIWIADMEDPLTRSPEIASTGFVATDDVQPPRFSETRQLRRLTNISAATYDPVWTTDNTIVFTNFEQFRFTIRSLPNLDSLMAHPRERQAIDIARTGDYWAYEKIGTDMGASRLPYRRKYKLDIAQGALSQNPVLGTTGGAVVAFSDMMGDDYLYLTLFNSGTTGNRDFLKSLSLMATRVQLKKRANIFYGLYRFGGQRYDITDPDAPSEFPVFWETIYGGQFGVSYPLSKFRRIEFASSLSWSDKEIPVRQIDREALLLSNSISLVHDNALYYFNGPIEGWRGTLQAAYTTDVRYSNVNYYSVIGDLRHYWRITPNITFASWGMARMNFGRESRLYVLGGSWDLRGFRLYDVRGKKMWFTSHELRFPILQAPSIMFPILAPFGIVNLRGALFFDAAHAWNDDYNAVNRQLLTGETLGATGIGFRMNLFGGFVLRYDIGYRYRDGFARRDKKFRQFFFGFDF